MHKAKLRLSVECSGWCAAGLISQGMKPSAARLLAFQIKATQVQVDLVACFGYAVIKFASGLPSASSSETTRRRQAIGRSGLHGMHESAACAGTAGTKTARNACSRGRG